MRVNAFVTAGNNYRSVAVGGRRRSDRVWADLNFDVASAADVGVRASGVVRGHRDRRVDERRLVLNFDFVVPAVLTDMVANIRIPARADFAAITTNKFSELTGCAFLRATHAALSACFPEVAFTNQRVTLAEALACVAWCRRLYKWLPDLPGSREETSALVEDYARPKRRILTLPGDVDA